MINKIHQIWFQGERNAPPELQEFSRKWKKTNHGYLHRVWEEKSMDTFIREHYPNYYSRYRNFPHMIQKIDFFKYAVLNIEGGFYIDMDVECLKPIDLPDKYKQSDFIASRNPTMAHENLVLAGMTEFYNNAVLYSSTESPILKSLIKRAFKYDCMGIKKTECVFFTTGPIIYSRIIDKFKHSKLKINIIPSAYFEPVWMPRFNTIDTYINKFNKQQIGEHKFNASWSENTPILKIVFIIYIHIRYLLPFIMTYSYIYYRRVVCIFMMLYAIAVAVIKLYICYKLNL
jgi:inositol phosphorylceramide mannosyltransferase catalytic subunit